MGKGADVLEPVVVQIEPVQTVSPASPVTIGQRNCWKGHVFRMAGRESLDGGELFCLKPSSCR